MSSSPVRWIWLAGLLLIGGCAAMDRAQPQQSAEARIQRISDAMPHLATGGRISRIDWSDDSSLLSYTRGDQRLEYNLQTRTLKPTAQETSEVRPPASERRRTNANRPARGRQRERITSPDGKWVAICKDWNVIIEPNSETRSEASESNQDAASNQTGEQLETIHVTTDGHRKFRYGTASWVYGEELDQTDAMWWSPDSRKLAFYEFDERSVPDHFLLDEWTGLHTRVLTEGYPKPGEPNPIANLLIYDLESKQTIRIDLPQDQQEWYTYGVQFTPDESSSQLLFHRTNRRQNVLHLMAADPDNGGTRIVLTETQDTWQDNSPTLRFLKDGRRFIWATETTGFRQLQLRDLDGTLLATLTDGEYPISTIIRIDEDAGVLWYTAFPDRAADRFAPLHAQVFRVNLDGTNRVRLTWDASVHHSAEISPNGQYLVVTKEGIGRPPSTHLYDADGNYIDLLACSDSRRMRELRLPMPEPFTCKADDGVTDLFGVLYKPSNFDPRRKYPLVIEVYGGPLSQSVRARFNPAKPECEYGVLIAQVDNRGTANRGKAFESAAYLKLGDVDLADQAAAVRYLKQRSYVDGSRVGITGHSYGGYMAALALLKYPDLFHVAVAGGTVTDWRNYDTIYTERFMRTPQENPHGYDNGSCMKYASQLKGRLLLLHGMMDDNVHPNNAWQLLDALHEANKWQHVEMMFFPKAGHSLGAAANRYRWAFLRQHLLN